MIDLLLVGTLAEAREVQTAHLNRHTVTGRDPVDSGHALDIQPCKSSGVPVREVELTQMNTVKQLTRDQRGPRRLPHLYIETQSGSICS